MVFLFVFFYSRNYGTGGPSPTYNQQRPKMLMTKIAPNLEVNTERVHKTPASKKHTECV